MIDSNIKNIQEIYIQLLNEGTDVWRPTQAIILGKGLFKILPTSKYDPEDEVWEFPPGAIVKGEEKMLSGERVLVAVKS